MRSRVCDALHSACRISIKCPSRLGRRFGGELRTLVAGRGSVRLWSMLRCIGSIRGELSSFESTCGSRFFRWRKKMRPDFPLQSAHRLPSRAIHATGTFGRTAHPGGGGWQNLMHHAPLGDCRRRQSLKLPKSPTVEFPARLSAVNLICDPISWQVC